jgi:hypothetical protein
MLLIHLSKSITPYSGRLGKKSSTSVPIAMYLLYWKESGINRHHRSSQQRPKTKWKTIFDGECIDYVDCHKQRRFTMYSIPI